ncbi:MAG: hypothetical protein KBB54_03595 [Candidatus Pacebacteria bacterium]|nr:hypothetical protein [Candidatus Paceibacterota bacterium]MBP9818742.1 hypothetical protein [Candidatus Paceibacterota bacterium]
MSREKLAQLEETGEYVFHGSSEGTIEELEPRQSNHIPDLNDPTKSIPDGRPAVSTTPHAELAIFRAIVNKKNVDLQEWHSGFGVRDGAKEFRVSSPEVLDQVKDKEGFVYVFNKSKFKPYTRGKAEDEGRPESMEWRAYEKVKPVEVVKVTDKDLPDRNDIHVRNNE